MRNKNKYKYRFLLAGALVLAAASPVFANSSWIWISETRPYDVLPFVASVTIAVETLMIYYFGKVESFASTGVVAVFSNLLSFLAPYVVSMMNPLYSFSEMLEHLPIYTVGAYYLILTLAVETPVVYHVLKEKAANRKTLLRVIAAANIITTILVTAAERIFCEGYWA